MSVIDAIIAKKLCSSGGSSAPKPLTYDYMPEGYPKKTMGTVTLMEEREIEFVLTDDGLHSTILNNFFEVVVGQTYTVNWDGTEYECVCIAEGPTLVLGNVSIRGHGADTGEPFLYTYIKYNNRGQFFTLDTSETHTISVKRVEETVTPMAEEFIPTGANSTTVFYYA